MKKMTMILMATMIILLSSCGDSREKIALDYIKDNAVLFDVKFDISPKIVEFEQIKTITARDSAMICDSVFREMSPDWKISKLRIDAEYLLGLQKLTGVHSQEELNETKKDIEKYKQWEANIKNNDDYSGTPFEKLDKLRKDYKSRGDEVLANVVACTYTIKNPILNNAIVSVDATYYFSSDNKSIIGSE